jgi:hypothetical protein
MNFSNSTMRIYPLIGGEQAPPSSSHWPSRNLGPSWLLAGLFDNWTFFPGEFTNSGRTELLAYDATTGEAKVLSVDAGAPKPIGPGVKWSRNALVTVTRLGADPAPQILVRDPSRMSMEQWRWSPAGFSRVREWQNASGYRMLDGKRNGLSQTPLMPGNFIHSGDTEFLVHTGIWLVLLRLDPKEGFVQLAPDLTKTDLRGLVMAGHFSSATTSQIFNLNNIPDPPGKDYKRMREAGMVLQYAGDNLYGEANFYQIDPARGVVALSPRATGLEKYWANDPWKIYPPHPPRGELTTMLFRGNGVGFLRYDPKTTICRVAAVITTTPGLWPKTLLTQVCYGKFAGSNAPAIALYDPATFNPTENALSDFDLCLARSQEALNTQIARSWSRWMKEKVEVFYAYKDGKVGPSKTGMRAYVGPIQLEMAEPNGRLDQIRVKVNLLSGVVTYFDADGELRDYSFSTWQFSVLMSLNSSAVDANYLELIDPDGAKSVRFCVKKSGLPDSAFSIECLFLKSTDTRGRGEENVTVMPLANAPGEAEIVMKRCVNLWRQGEVGRFLLGTVTRPAPSPSPPPTFSVTSLIFNVHADFEKPSASTLAWLGMMEGRPLPDLTPAVTKLTDSWLRPPTDRPGVLPMGVMGISRNMFMDRYVIPKFAAALGVTASFAMRDNRPQWTFSGRTSDRSTSDDIIHRVFEKTTTWTVRLAIVPFRETVEISGDVVSQCDMDGYLHVFGSKTEWIHTRGRQRLTGELQLGADYSKGYFAVKPSLRFWPDGGIVVEEDTIGGGANVLNAFESFFTGSTTARRLENAQRGLIDNLSKWMEQALNGLNLEFRQSAFIPPGGGVLTFRNAQFSKHGDLLFDVVEDYSS